MGKYFNKEAGFASQILGYTAVGVVAGAAINVGIRAAGRKKMKAAPPESIEGGIYQHQQDALNPKMGRKAYITRGMALVSDVQSGKRKPVYGKLENYQKALTEDTAKRSGGDWNTAFGSDYDSIRGKKKLPLLP